MEQITKEQFDNLQGEVDNLKKQLEDFKNRPEPNRVQRYKEINYYTELRVDNLYGGLPIDNTSGTINHFQGQIYITKIGSTSSLCTLIDGVRKKVNLS